MRKPRKWIAALLTAVMLFSTLPGAAFSMEGDVGSAPTDEQANTPADNPSEEDKEGQEMISKGEEIETPDTTPSTIENNPYMIPNDTVTFNTSYLDIEVGYDVEKAEQGETPYVLFVDDGSYTIELYEEAPFFPYEVQFTYQGQTTTEWFMDEDDCVIVGGHPFYVACLAGPPTYVSLEISGENVPAYPERKVFTNDPDHGIAPASLLPLKEVHLEVDLTKFLPAELKNVGISTVLPGQSVADGAAVVWAKGYSDDNFTIADKNVKFDLSPGRGSSSPVYLELIVGTADQLDKSNIRYIVNADICPLSDVLTFSAFTKDGEALQVFDQYCSDDGNGGQRYQFNIGEGKWTEGPARISMALNSQFPNQNSLRAVVYEGRFTTPESLPAAAGREVSDIWKTSGTGAHLADYSDWQNAPEFTLVLYRGEEIAQLLAFSVNMYLGRFSLYPSYYLYAESTNPYSTYRPQASSSRNYDRDDYSSFLFAMGRGYPANGSYYLNLSLENPNPNDESGGLNGINFVKKAVVGSYKSETEAADAADIKTQLFSDAQENGGYKADYSQGVTFTVFTTNGKVLSVTVKAVEDKELPSAPRPLSADTYFQMRYAYKKEGSSQFNYYVMPYGDDSYYYNGYQTVFLLDGTSAIPDGTTIYPVFYQGNKVDVHLGHDNESTVKQESGKSSITLKSGEAIHYSAAAENGTHLKNYWVTFLTKQSGAKLFVNGATNADPSHCEADGTPIREVFLDDAHGNHHDVFFANIGDAELTGLYVKLENAQSIKLDDYWTIREGTKSTSLSAFDSTIRQQIGSSDSAYYGQLKNVAKVRLIPDGTGAISGTLVIGSTATNEEVRIKLTGTAGVPKITTTSIVDGVKYVPYSSVIQTNNMYASNAIKFELVSGALPAGMIVKPNGEVYGVPQVAGTFTFKVRATYNNDPTLYDEKEFTLKIAENTDSNVYTATDSGYDVTVHIGEDRGSYHFVLDGYKNQTFKTEGELGYFIDLWLDGRKLVRDVDYTAESGSTVITIFGETLDGNDDGNGNTHTIAAEFREGDKDEGTLKRAAQNYVIEGVSSKPSNPGPSGPGPSNPGTSNPGTSRPGGNNGGSSNTNKKPDTTTPSKDDGKQNETSTPVPETPAAIYTDVKEQDWFYDDLKWAKDNDIMTGVGNNAFAPDDAISQATIVTTLARLLKIDLTQFDEITYDDVTPGQWFTNAAIWAKQSGILPDYSAFTGTGELSRDGMAIMLVKFLRSMGVDTDIDLTGIDFADADQMTDAGREAFQILYHYGIFRGVGGNRMDPLSSTTRAQFAALMHRISIFVESR